VYVCVDFGVSFSKVPNGQMGAHNTPSPVIKLGVRYPRKTERKGKEGNIMQISPLKNWWQHNLYKNKHQCLRSAARTARQLQAFTVGVSGLRDTRIHAHMASTLTRTHMYKHATQYLQILKGHLWQLQKCENLLSQGEKKFAGLDLRIHISVQFIYNVKFYQFKFCIPSSRSWQPSWPAALLFWPSPTCLRSPLVLLPKTKNTFGHKGDTPTTNPKQQVQKIVNNQIWRTSRAARWLILRQAMPLVLTGIASWNSSNVNWLPWKLYMIF